MICRPCEIARTLPAEVEHICKLYEVPLSLVIYACSLRDRCRVWHEKCKGEDCDCDHRIEVSE